MPSSWQKQRFDLVELCGISLLVGCAVLLLTRSARSPLPYGVGSAIQESARLKATYGPGRFSENEEEWVLRDYFEDRREGFFVDVGANHYQTFSNTYYLEVRLGWSGLAIEPQSSFADGYRTHRPRTRFLPFFASDVSNETARMFLLESNPLVTSSSRDFTQRFGKEVKQLDAPTITLTDLLDQLEVKQVDLLSIDVELAEPKVLAGFDIDRFRPALICIEAHLEVRQQILEYFARHRYVVIGKYLRADQQNLYFAPVS